MPGDAGLWVPRALWELPAPSSWGVPPEPSDARGRECLRLLQQLHGRAQRLWEVTERSLRSLRERLRHPEAVRLESLLLLREADHVLHVHVE